MLSKILDALTSGVQSIVNPTKSFTPRRMLALIARPRGSNAYSLTRWHVKRGLTPTRLLAEANLNETEEVSK